MRQKPNKHRPTILIVDDDPLVAEAAAGMLGMLGYRVKCVYDARSAMEALHHPVDLLLIDVIMPKVDGFMLADMAKIVSPTTKVIYVTGDIEAASRHQQDDAGVLYGPLIQKPYGSQELRVAIAAALN